MKKLIAMMAVAALIPFAAATADHQSANARGLVEAGAAILMPERGLTPEALAEQIENLLEQPDAALRMSQNAQAQGKPEAAEALASLVEELAQEGKSR